MKRKTVLPLLGLLCLMGWQARANAHGVAITYQSTQAYEIKAAYDTGKPMANAQVAVFSPNDATTPWKTGTTDQEGRFVFTPAAPGNWEVQVRQAGHGDVLVIPVQGATTATASPESGEPTATNPESAPEPAVTAPIATQNAGYTPLQRGVMMGTVIWGCVGTALFFARGKKRVERDAHS